MKFNLLKLLSLLLVSSALLLTSCSDDEDDIVIDPGEGGLALADGLYLQAEGQDPVSSAQLTAETVDAPDFSSQERSGFVGGYMFLTAGTYNVVVVTEKEVTSTIGGSSETITDTGSDCDLNDYIVVTTQEGGAGFTVPADGLYKVTHDQMRGELVMYNIQKAQLIGSATPNGWDGAGGQDMEGTASATGASFTVSDVIMREGEFKFRFNCRWSIDRKIDPAGGLEAANGYISFTNFGGDINDLQAGNNGPNIQLAADDEGVYDLSIDWSPQNGWSASATRTGDAPEITFVPEDFQWAVIGDATAGGWNADQKLIYRGLREGAYVWAGVATISDMGSFKLRSDDSWSMEHGGSLTYDGVEMPLGGGDNLVAPAMGAYYFVIKTADEGDTWTISALSSGWGVIGIGSPQGDWAADMDMTVNPFDNGVSTYSITGDFTTESWKVRAGDDWVVNFGGSIDAPEVDGADFQYSEAGNYTVTLSFDGTGYSMTSVKN